MRVPQKIALTGALLAAGAGVGLALPAVAQDSGTTPPATEQPADPPADRPPRDDASCAERDQALADQLGVSVEDLQAAQEAAHQAVVDQFGEPERPEQPPQTDEEREALQAQMQERHDAFEQALAGELGVTVDQLREAHATLAEEHLAEDVAAGRITQEEADARLDAIRSGEAPPPGPGGPGGPHGPGGPGGPGGPPAQGD